MDPRDAGEHFMKQSGTVGKFLHWLLLCWPLKYRVPEQVLVFRMVGDVLRFPWKASQNTANA